MRIGSTLQFGCACLFVCALALLPGAAAASDADPGTTPAEPLKQPGAALEAQPPPSLEPDANSAASSPPAASSTVEDAPLGSKPTSRAVPRAPAGAGSSWTSSTTARTAGALAMVVGLAFLARFIVQRMVSRSSGLGAQLGPGGRAPSGVLEVLGRYPVGRGHTLVLLRMDRRVLLLGQSATGFTTLAQTNDPDEVASLLIKTRDEEDATISSRFTSVLREIESDPAVLTDDSDLRAAETNWPPSDGANEAADGAVGDLRRRLFGAKGLTA